MMLCGFRQKHYIVYANSPDAVSHNVISVVLQIRVSDLAAQHQRLLTDQSHAKKTRGQQADRLAHIHRSLLHLYGYTAHCVCTFKSPNMLIRSHHTTLAYLCLHFSPQIKKMYIYYCFKCPCTFRTIFNTNSKTLC